MRVLFWLLVAVAAVSTVGAFIVQNAPPWAYEKLYGEEGARLIFALGVHDIFGSFYFIALLAWTALSLVACVIVRLRSLAHSRDDGGSGFISQRSLALAGEPRQFLIGVQSRLKRGGWRVSKLDERALYADRARWAWWASPALHLGLVLLLAAGLVKLIVGESRHLVLYENQPQLLPPSLAAGLEVNADSFDTVIDPNSGRVLTYYTELTVTGTDGLSRVRLEVNAPARRDGVTFYQSFMDELAPTLLLIGERAALVSYVERRSAYENEPLVLEALELRLTPLEGGGPSDFFTVEPAGGPFPCPGTPWSVAVRRYFPNHRLGPEPGTDLDTNPEPNPAVRLDLYLEEERVVERALVYRRHPDFLDPKLAAAGIRIELGSARWTRHPEPSLPEELRAYRLYPGDPAEGLAGTWFRLPEGEPALLEVDPPRGLKLTLPSTELILPAPAAPEGENILDLGSGYAAGYLNGEPERVTGLEAKRDPGLPLFWAGAVLLVLGGTLVFATPWKRLWLRLEEKTVALKTRRLPERELRRLLNPEGGEPS